LKRNLKEKPMKAERQERHSSTRDFNRVQSQSQGQALDSQTRAALEPRFGHSFGDVRVFADGEADRLARDYQARAFTVGQDVYFRDGEYDPDSPGGLSLLAHELTHTIQQRGAKPGNKPLEVSQHGDAGEREARTASSQVLAGRSAQVSGTASLGVARDPEGEAHHHKGGWLDHLFGLNPDRSFVEAGLNPLIGQDGLLAPKEGDGTGTTLAKAGGSVLSLPYIAEAAIGGHVLDEINHGPLMLHGAFDW
jgi:Domain of unknown function (DUF4157)